MKKWIIIFCLIGFFFIVSFVVLTRPKKSDSSSDKETTKYPYLASRIFQENPKDIIINFTHLRSELRTYISEHHPSMGVFFEYLPNGTSIGINDREAFFQASLVKIPTVMRIYKLIELGKLTEDQVFTLEEKHIDPNYGLLWKRGDGYKISLSEVIKLAVVDSDNSAYELLNDVFNQTKTQFQNNDFPEVYDYLDIPIEETQQNVTPRNYSSILKSLYFSAYLSFENSNKILDLMRQSTYITGIRAGIPDQTAVAHKFGLRKSDLQEHEVHSDCGIVYIPLRPYIVCVMIPSDDEERTALYMREISRKISDYIMTTP